MAHWNVGKVTTLHKLFQGATKLRAAPGSARRASSEDGEKDEGGRSSATATASARRAASEQKVAAARIQCTAKSEDNHNFSTDGTSKATRPVHWDGVRTDTLDKRHPQTTFWQSTASNNAWWEMEFLDGPLHVTRLVLRQPNPTSKKLRLHDVKISCLIKPRTATGTSSNTVTLLSDGIGNVDSEMSAPINAETSTIRIFRSGLGVIHFGGVNVYHMPQQERRLLRGRLPPQPGLQGGEKVAEVEAAEADDQNANESEIKPEPEVEQRHLTSTASGVWLHAYVNGQPVPLLTALADPLSDPRTRAALLRTDSRPWMQLWERASAKVATPIEGVRINADGNDVDDRGLARARLGAGLPVYSLSWISHRLTTGGLADNGASAVFKCGSQVQSASTVRECSLRVGCSLLVQFVSAAQFASAVRECSASAICAQVLATRKGRLKA
eukprot:g5574.t1